MSIKARVWFGVLFLQLCFLHIADAAVLEGLRVNKLPDRVQIVLDMDTPVPFQQFSLPNPPRIVLDFPEVKRKSNRHVGMKIDTAPVAGVRTGYTNDHKFRAVIDLKSVARANIYTLPAQKKRHYRVVVDVYHRQVAPALVLESYDGDQYPYVMFAGGPLTEKHAARDGLSHVEQGGSAEKTVETQVSSKGYVKSQEPIKTSVVAKAQPIVITIDPGHGGIDPGAPSVINGLREKDIVLSIAKRLKRHLEEKQGFRVVMTRESDVFLKLHQRRDIARKNHADLFVSIHANSVKSSVPRGASVYMLSTGGASSLLARYLAQQENAVDIKWGGGDDNNKYDKDTRRALFDIQQETTLESSDILAEKTLRELSKIGKVHGSRVERANFVVLRSPEIPSMLVETGFISNPSDARLLATPAYQEKIATGIANGIQRYFDEHLPQHALLEVNR